MPHLIQPALPAPRLHRLALFVNCTDNHKYDSGEAPATLGEHSRMDLATVPIQDPQVGAIGEVPGDRQFIARAGDAQAA